ncbi:MAG: two-CW domain-containing protein [Bacteroidota bacterium]
MSDHTLNCWEYMKCGRQPGGNNVDGLGVCPAATDTKYNLINRGFNSGRFCWYVEATFCNRDVQGTFFDKFDDCLRCEFFLLVEKQEAQNLEIVPNGLQ